MLPYRENRDGYIQKTQMSHKSELVVPSKHLEGEGYILK